MVPGAADRVLTYSASYTVDVTYRCARRCGYCEYRTDTGGLVPWETVDAQLDEATSLGVREILVMSGEQPWLLPDIGLDGEAAFVARVVEICRRAMRRGLLPHANVGLLSAQGIAALKPWNVSMGLMLESGTDQLRAHAFGGGKRVADRLRHIEDAGRLRIPFTTGILVGIGESRADRERALHLIAGVQRRHGHIQEVIVQNFVPKPGTPMAAHPAADPATMLDTVRTARALLPIEVTVQVPPNLLGDGWLDLVDAGARDLGGISANGDSVSPSRPWEAVGAYAAAARSRGYVLRERLPVYPQVAADVRTAADSMRAELSGEDAVYVRAVAVDAATAVRDTTAALVRVEQAVAAGATQVSVRVTDARGAGMHDLETLIARIRNRGAAVHVDAVDPHAVVALATREGLGVDTVMRRLADAGMGGIAVADHPTMLRAAHRAGVRTTATVRVDPRQSWHDRLARLHALRELQRETAALAAVTVVLAPAADGAHACDGRDPTDALDPVGTTLRCVALARLVFGADVPRLECPGAEALRWGASGLGAVCAPPDAPIAASVAAWRATEAAIRAAGRVPRAGVPYSSPSSSAGLTTVCTQA